MPCSRKEIWMLPPSADHVPESSNVSPGWTAFTASVPPSLSVSVTVASLSTLVPPISPTSVYSPGRDGAGRGEGVAGASEPTGLPLVLSEQAVTSSGSRTQRANSRRIGIRIAGRPS
jgi:hypothetical protein